MHKAGAAAVDGTAEEGHTNRLLMGYPLKGANKVSSLQILSLTLAPSLEFIGEF